MAAVICVILCLIAATVPRLLTERYHEDGASWSRTACYVALTNDVTPLVDKALGENEIVDRACDPDMANDSDQLGP